MKFEIGMGQRAYARHRGCDKRAVAKALWLNGKSGGPPGRIHAALLPDGTIDVELADRLWELNTDPTQRRGKEALRAATSMAAMEAARQAPEPEAEPDETSPIEDVEDDGEPGEPTPPPRRPEVFEEDPPRRRGGQQDDDDNVVRLAEHIAANKAKAAGRGVTGPAPGVPSEESAELAESLLALAIEEKREKVRKLRLANDEKEKSLVPLKEAEAHVFAFFHAATEDWQIWPDVFGPDFAAKHNIDQRAVIQDLKDGVRARLEQQAGAAELRLDA